jgi:hypothetical protein
MIDHFLVGIVRRGGRTAFSAWEGEPLDVH